MFHVLRSLGFAIYDANTEGLQQLWYSQIETEKDSIQFINIEEPGADGSVDPLSPLSQKKENKVFFLDDYKRV